MKARQRHYDAIVVGAGPAGSATAARLADAGARVLMVDRFSFPRDKACGGGITPRGTTALRDLRVDVDRPTFMHVVGLEVVAQGHVCRTEFPKTDRWSSIGLVVRRKDLDAAVLERAVSAGVEFRAGVRVLGPVVENGVCRGIRATCNGREFENLADYTVGADGATSLMARRSGLAKPTASGDGFWYAALRGYFGPVAPTGGAAPVLEFYPLRTKAGRWLPGYGWVFPLPEGGANVGVDLPHRPVLRGAPPLREAYRCFVSRLREERPGFGRAAEESAPVGALLPEGMRGIRPGMVGMLLVGDAAGLITPYSGEGIAYALESANLAARSIVASQNPHCAVESYRCGLWNEYGFHFTLALAFMKAVRRPTVARLAANIGIRHQRVLRAAVRVMAYLIEPERCSPSTVSSAHRALRRVFPRQPGAAWRGETMNDLPSARH